MRTRLLVAASATLLLAAPAHAQPACTFMSVADYLADPFYSCVLGGRLEVGSFVAAFSGFPADLADFGVIPIEEPGYVGFHVGFMRFRGPDPIVGSSETPGLANLKTLTFGFVGASLTGAPVTGASARLANGWWDITPAAGWYARAWANATSGPLGGPTQALYVERYTPGFVPIGLYPSVCTVDFVGVPCDGFQGTVHADFAAPSTFVYGAVGLGAVVVDQGLPKTPGAVATSMAGQGGIYLDIAAAPVSAVPEPATAWLLGAGLAAGAGLARRARRG